MLKIHCEKGAHYFKYCPYHFINNKDLYRDQLIIEKKKLKYT